jgi:hypothetical protein
MSLHPHAHRATEIKNRPVAPNQPSPLVRAGTQTGGQLLDRHTQSRMSARFGHDFSQVRIHTDTRAEDSAAALGANAYAHGSDIVFGAGKYTPGSVETERLLAHELTHVAQQGYWGVGDRGRASDSGDASEREADSLASQVLAGRSVQAQARPGAAVARQVDPAAGPMMNMMFNPSAYHPDFGPQSMMQSSASGSVPAPAPQAQVSTPDDGPSLASTAYNVATDNTLGTALSMGEEGLKAVGGSVGPLGVANKILAPVGVVSNGISLHNDIEDGHFGDAALDATALTGSAIGTASMTGLIGSASVLNPVGVAAGTFAGAYAGSSKVLGAANDYAANNVILGREDDGEARNTTQAAGDAGQWVDDKVHSATDWIPGIGHGLGSLIGGPAGATTAMVSSVGTELYAGAHALGSYLFGGGDDNAPLPEPGAGSEAGAPDQDTSSD